MIVPSPPPGLVRSLSLIVGAGVTTTLAGRSMLTIVAASDLTSVAALVGGSAALAWAAARIALVERATAAQAFVAGLGLPIAIAFLLPRQPRPATNDNTPAASSDSWLPVMIGDDRIARITLR